MKQKQAIATSVMFVLVCLFTSGVPDASAHEGREIGPYEIQFGWQVEPAYAGIYNGPELRIVQKGATEADEKPVTSAEKRLQLKVMFGNQSKVLKLQPDGQDPGHYTASLTPTRPGDYTFQLTGTISSTGAMSTSEMITPTVINEKFTSTTGEFSTVEPASDILFPDTKADMVSLQTQIDALKTQIKALQADITTLKAAKK